MALAHISLGWSKWTVDPEDLKRNSLPALALIGKDDTFLRDTKELATRMSSLAVKVLPGDHGSLPAQPAFLKELLEHLRKTTGTTGQNP